jgi:SEC-C motif-containing protein
LKQEAIALTAEQLMRARFSAYVLNATDFLLSSWDENTRPNRSELNQDEQLKWKKLSVIRTEKGKETDETGLVEFIAQGQASDQVISLHETSRFKWQDGRWFYIDGVIHPVEKPTSKIPRNAPCPCGSGKKYKRCCGA